MSRSERLLAEAVAREQILLAKWLDEQAEAIVGPVPQTERLTWDAKETAALAYGGTISPEQLALLQAEADMTGESLASLVGLILVRAAVFRAVGPRLAGTRRAAAAAMAQATSVAEVVAAREAAEADFSAWLAVLLAPPQEPA